MKKDKLDETCNAKVRRVGQEIFGVKDPTWHVHTLPLISFWIIFILAVASSIIFGKSSFYSPFWGSILYIGILGGTIMGYFYFYLKKYEECAVLADPMNKKLFSLFGFPISAWPLSHFLLHLIWTVLVPSNWPYYLATGLVWEGIELLMKTTAKETTLSRTARTRLNDKGDYSYLTYWESTWEDIIINSAGIVVGLLISKHLSYDKVGRIVFS